MKHKTASLEGALLDAAVAFADGWALINTCGRKFWRRSRPGHESHPALTANVEHYRPSTDWSIGGPIIERERIALIYCVGTWNAATHGFVDIEGGITSERQASDFCRGEASDAPTPLIAAMRAYVAAKMGEEVELP